MRKPSMIVLSLLLVCLSVGTPETAYTASCAGAPNSVAAGTHWGAWIQDAGARASALRQKCSSHARHDKAPQSDNRDPYTYGSTVACDEKDPDHQTVRSCGSAMEFCQYLGANWSLTTLDLILSAASATMAAGIDPGKGPHYYLWRKAKRPSNASWQYYGETCSPQGKPGVPPVPSTAQLQTAFKALPFSRPRVHIQPEGNLTLVNLATYYEAQWPGDAGLQPGETSKPVQLLSWSVRFRISAYRYNFQFGDGESTGPVTDVGGPYPTGSVTHIYDKASAATPVHVDAQLTGEYQVNGTGDWISIDTVADLKNEPVTTLVVKTAKNRLYNN